MNNIPLPIQPYNNDLIVDHINIETTDGPGQIDTLSHDVGIIEDVLKKNCTIKEVTHIIIQQINELQRDIKDIESMRDTMKTIFPKDANSYRNAYIIENKVKTFTGFYQTILSFKKELTSLLFKLRETLNTGGSVDEFKAAIREVMSERNNIQMKSEDNKQRIENLLKESPNLMPSKQL